MRQRRKLLSKGAFADRRRSYFFFAGFFLARPANRLSRPASSNLGLVRCEARALCRQSFAVLQPNRPQDLLPTDRRQFSKLIAQCPELVSMEDERPTPSKAASPGSLCVRIIVLFLSPSEIASRRSSCATSNSGLPSRVGPMEVTQPVLRRQTLEPSREPLADSLLPRRSRQAAPAYLSCLISTYSCGLVSRYVNRIALPRRFGRSTRSTPSRHARLLSLA